MVPPVDPVQDRRGERVESQRGLLPCRGWGRDGIAGQQGEQFALHGVAARLDQALAVRRWAGNAAMSTARGASPGSRIGTEISAKEGSRSWGRWRAPSGSRWRRRWRYGVHTNLHPTTGSIWRLHHDGQEIARLTVTDTEMFWVHADIETLPGFEPFRPVFAEQERAAEAKEWDRSRRGTRTSPRSSTSPAPTWRSSRRQTRADAGDRPRRAGRRRPAVHGCMNGRTRGRAGQSPDAASRPEDDRGVLRRDRRAPRPGARGSRPRSVTGYGGGPHTRALSGHGTQERSRAGRRVCVLTVPRRALREARG